MAEGSFCARLVLAVLATWRVTHLLASEDGPADLMVRFRARLGKSLAGALMDCFNCLSLWIAAPAALFVSRSLLLWLFSWLGVSGGACLLERLGTEPVEMQPISESFEGDNHHVLRSETIRIADSGSCDNVLSTARYNSQAGSTSAEQRDSIWV
jgi:hypothetical protein